MTLVGGVPGGSRWRPEAPRDARPARARRRPRLPRRSPAAPPARRTARWCSTPSMTGYQEILTDPSYRGQIVCMTYPLIGNYGINPEDVESRRPWLDGFIVKEACAYPSSWRGRMHARRLPARARHRRHPGHRHARAHAPPARPRRPGGHHLHGGAGRATARRAGARAARPARPRPRERGDAWPRPTAGTRATWDLGARLSPAAGRRASAWSPSTRASSSNILRQLAALGCARRRGARATRPPRRCWSGSRTASSSPTARAIPRRWPTWSRRCAASSARSPIFGICLGNQILGLAARRPHLQAQVRPSRRQPPGEGPRHRARGDHRAEPRLRGGSRRRSRRPGFVETPRQPQRRDVGGHAAPRAAGLLRAVPPGGLAGPARRALPVPIASST